jgi:fermentation-respiration switch protein FrsA (DUF1100 family)
LGDIIVQDRRPAIRAGQAAAVADLVLPFFFCPATYRNQPELIADYRRRLVREQDREGLYQAALAVFNRGDITDELPNLRLPTLVVVGAEDISTPPDRSRLLADKISGAVLKMIPDAGHMSATEQPAMVADGCSWCVHHGYTPGQHLTAEGVPVEHAEGPAIGDNQLDPLPQPMHPLGPITIAQRELLIDRKAAGESAAVRQPVSGSAYRARGCNGW